MNTMNQKLVRLLTRILLPSLILLLLIFTTHPYKLPIILLVVPFLLIFIIIYQTITVFLANLLGKTRKRQRINAAILAGGIVILALLESIRQLSIRDLIIIIVLIVALSFYIRRIDI